MRASSKTGNSRELESFPGAKLISTKDSLLEAR